jgi:hypothetical protein
VARDDRKAQFYQNYAAVHTYDRDEGLLMLPVAGEPVDGDPPVEIVRVHAPLGARRVEFTAKKLGTPPVVPHPEYLGDSNDVLAGDSVVVSQPSPVLNGTGYRWTVSGVYTYYQLDARTPSDGYPTGYYPFTSGPDSPGFVQQMTAAGEMLPETPLPVDQSNAQAVYAYINSDYAYYGTEMQLLWFDPTMISG